MAGLSCKHNQMMAKVTLKSVHDKPGVAAEVFSVLAEQGIMVELLTTIPTGRNKGDISFAVPQDQVPAVKTQMERIRNEIGFKSVDSDPGVSVVNIFGDGLTSDPAVASRMLRALGVEGINLQMISQSLNYLSFMVSRAQLPQALAVLKNSFGIEA